MKKQDRFFQYGTQVAAAMHGTSKTELNHRLGMAKVMESQDATPFNRELCKIAAAAFTAADEPNSAAAILFQNLSEIEEWNPGYNRITDCVKRAMSKQALLPAIVAANELGGSGLVKTLLATGVVGGAGLGSLGYLLSRNIQQSSSENATLLEKVRAYKQLKRDIEEDMHTHNAMGSDQVKEQKNYDV